MKAWEVAAKAAMGREAVIVIPSRGRAGSVVTHKLFPGAILFVAEGERVAYEAEHDVVETHPDAIAGNMAQVRNAIIDRWPDRNIVMLDDDILKFGYFERGQFNELADGGLAELIEAGFVLACDVGAYLWGINLSADRQFYREYTPFSFISPVLGPFTAHRPNPLRYDTRFPLKEDYDFALQHMLRFRKILRLNKYYYYCLHLLNDGGVTAVRTMDREAKQLEALQRKWGADIIRYDVKESINPTIHAPLSGV